VASRQAGDVRVNGRRRTLRTGVALAASTLTHLLALAVFLTTGPNMYRLPEPRETPPVEVEIERAPLIIPPERLPPIPKPPPVETPISAQPKVNPPVPTPQPPPPPKTAPEPPKQTAAPTQPAPLREVVVKPAPTPTPTPPKPVTPSPAPNPAPAPQVAPAPTPQPAAPAPTPPSPPAPQHPPATPAPATAPGPVAPRLNVHKSEKEAPAGTPTLPFAPAPTQPPSGARPPSAPGGGPTTAGGGGSRLQGLTPYPPGAFPNGGPGLRGSLVGCANPDAVSLSAVERAHCEARFGSYPGGAPHFDPISPERRAVFDKENDRAERDRAYRNSGTDAGTATGLGGVAPGSTATHIPLPR
jgi:hypothetical protein